MAVVHDVMPAFELFQPASVDDALELLGRHGSDAWVMAGGLDTFDWLKDRIKRPRAVIDLSADHRAQRHPAAGRRPRDRCDDDAHRGGAASCDSGAVRHPGSRRPRRRPRRRSGTRARSAATSLRTRGAGTTAPDGCAIAPVGTSATPIRRPPSTASTRFSTPTGAWPSIRRTRRRP